MTKMWYTCKPNEKGPSDTIILYVESGNAPLAVEVPDGGGVGVGAGAGAGVGGSAGVGAGAGQRLVQGVMFWRRSLIG